MYHQHNSTIEEEIKLHNNSEEEEKRLRRQFVAISKLCSSDTTSSTTSCPWNRTSDEVVISLFTQPRKPTVLLFETTTDRPTDLLTHSIYQDRYCCTYPFEPKVDGEVRTIAIDVLKQLIGRLETEKNPMNIIPVGEAK